MPLSPGIFNRLFKQQDRNPCEGLHYYIDNTNDDKNISPYRGPANGLSECCSPRSVDRGRRLYDLQRFRERSVRFRAEQRVVSLSGPSRTARYRQVLRSPAARNSCSTAPITRCGRFPPIPSCSFTRSGGWIGPMSHRLGTIRATSSSATMSGSDSRRSFCPAFISATARSSEHGLS